MSLIHALVAREQTILAEHQQAGKRDFSQATQTILSKIPPNDSKLTYVWEQYLFHYGEECLLPSYLSYNARHVFNSAPSSSARDDLPAYGLQGSFGSVISSLMHTYNTAPPTDELARAQSELNQVKDIMVQNVEQILSRGERIELLVDKTDAMAGQATAFRRGARSVRRQMWWKNKRVLGLSVIVALLGYVSLLSEMMD
ncbi:hypothetical protein D9756_007063 [Leucocoprinus leucothites]|uniref:Synaptobrevin homolog YKT6 n=1 Tax=Leucocoprinus leucothites TaxID=201217 RepID=A0A8H5D628_9AGAR|nr:hypothetical protein D9756_007063 [Leucoagaricus leucothites]